MEKLLFAFTLLWGITLNAQAAECRNPNFVENFFNDYANVTPQQRIDFASEETFGITIPTKKNYLVLYDLKKRLKPGFAKNK